jgi:hypothetical protein
MLLGAFQDLKFFLAFFGMVIITFSLLIFILLPQAPGATYLTPLSYLIIALRTSLGDNEMDDYKGDGEKTSLLTWAVWLLIMVVGNVVFMNFIIAVVSESYEKCMQKQTIEKYKLRV